MSKILKKPSFFNVFAIFLTLSGCDFSINAMDGPITPPRSDYCGNPDGSVSHFLNKTNLPAHEGASLEFHQWDRLSNGEGGGVDEKEYLRRLFSEGLESSEIEDLKKQTRFKLGLWGKYPAAKKPEEKKSVIERIKAFYAVVGDGSDNLKWAGNQHNVEEFFEKGLCCGEKKALDLAVCELYATLKDGTKPEQLTGSCKALYDFLSNPLPGTVFRWHVKNIFYSVLKHLDHCSEESRKAGHPHCDFPRLVESIPLFFGTTNPVDPGFIRGSGLGLSNFDWPEFRPIFEKLCRRDHSPKFREMFADETWGSRHLHGRNLGKVTFGLGALALAGLSFKRWFETRSIKYQNLSRSEKCEKTKKLRHIMTGILVGSSFIGFALFEFFGDRLAVKFLKRKQNLFPMIVPWHPYPILHRKGG